LAALCDAARVENAEERSLDARESSQRDDCHQVPLMRPMGGIATRWIFAFRVSMP
jgi:hypothetical protein